MAQKNTAQAKATGSAATPAVSFLSEAAFRDLAPLPNPKSKNVKLALRQRTKAETLALIEQTKKETTSPVTKKVVKQKKIVPSKPTKDEKGALHRLKKHDATKVGPFAQALAAKYNKGGKKKAAAPAKK